MAWSLPSRLGWLAIEPQGSSCLCLLRTGMTNVSHQPLLLYIGSGDQMQVLWKRVHGLHHGVLCLALPHLFEHVCVFTHRGYFGCFCLLATVTQTVMNMFWPGLLFSPQTYSLPPPSFSAAIGNLQACLKHLEPWAIDLSLGQVHISIIRPGRKLPNLG